jgi:uncharacterized protein (DUF1330 family)
VVRREVDVDFGLIIPPFSEPLLRKRKKHAQALHRIDSRNRNRHWSDRRPLNAQRPPAGYFIGEVLEVTNQAEFDTYATAAPATVAKGGGQYLVRGGKSEALEGEPPRRIVVVAFDSLDAARHWYTSPEYTAIKPIREGSSRGRLFIVEGVP